MPKIMLLGDTHGNTKFITNIVIPAAKSAGVEWIYQVGDFGYWEHMAKGVSFLNDVNDALASSGLSLVWIAGNHDKVSMARSDYPKIDDFHVIRSNIWFADHGTHWEFEGTSFLALGGAYSIDKPQRIVAEDQLTKRFLEDARRIFPGWIERDRLDYAKSKSEGQYWFPEEEMSDELLEDILSELEDTKIDVILAHDKPFMSNPGIKLLPIEACLPNQRRLQKAVNVLKPKLFVHGHLHVRYSDTIRCGDGDMFTRVEGLGADVPNFNQSEFDWTPKDAWKILDL